MKVLYLSYDGLTDPLGQSQILPYLLGLEKKGYLIFIISFEKKDRFREGKELITKQLENKNIGWMPKTYHRKPPIFSTLFDLWTLWRVSKKCHKNEEIDLVHCRSYLAGLIGLRLKMNYGIKFLFDIRGFWADERVDGGLWDLSNPVYKVIYQFFKKKEIEMMMAADHIISLTHAGKEEMTLGRLFLNKNIKINSAKISVIPCAVDLELFDPQKIKEQDRQYLKQKLGISNGEKVMIYLGSIGTWYLLDEMLQFFKKIAKQQPEFRFLFVTKDNPKLILDAASKATVDGERLIIAKAERGEVPLYLSIADLGIFFIKPLYSKKASSATKMGELLAMGIPIVTNQGVGDADNLLNETTFGISLDLFNYRIMNVSEILKIAISRDEIRKVAKKNFSLKNGIERYSEIYSKLDF